jgi:hypothetical protein
MRERVQQRLHSLRGAQPERGDIVLGWLTRVVVILGVAGVFLFDAISLGTTTMTLADQGSHAAREASEVWQLTGDVQLAYDEAVESATEANPLNVVDNTSFRISEDNTVRLTISREATTLVLFRWSKTAEWTRIEREAKGRSVG